MPCEARNRGGSLALGAKSTLFFAVRAGFRDSTREARGALCGFQHHKGENLYWFPFSDPITDGLRWIFFIFFPTGSSSRLRSCVRRMHGLCSFNPLGLLHV